MPTTYNTLPIGLFLETLKDVFVSKADTVRDFLPLFYNVEKTDRIQNSYQGFAGTGTIERWDGETTLTTKSVTPRYESTIIQSFFRSGYAYTWKMLKYNKYRKLMGELAASLALAGKNSMQTQGLAWFNNGFTDVWNTQENKPFFSATHTLLNGATYSNLQTGALTVSNLQSAITLLEKTPDDNGIILGLKAKYLFVNPSGLFNAMEVVNKGSQYKAGEANHTTNAFSAWGLEIVPCNWITDADSWFLRAETGFSTICEISNGLEQEIYDERSIKGKVHEAMYAMGVGANDWRGWVGSTGA